MNYGDLVAWQKAMDLVELVYRSTRMFPKEMYGLTAQMRRAAVSIPSNSAEGQGRGSDAELVRYTRVAYGSLRELETQTFIAKRLGYIEQPECQTMLDSTAEVGRLINGLINAKV